jgi:DNA-binding NarL/FixJ family response regulator
MIRILLVDDHELFRSSLRTRLEQEDGILPVGEAGTATHAVSKARTLQPDVVLLALILPRGNGYDAIPDLLTASPSMNIVIVSSQTQPTAIRQAIGAALEATYPNEPQIRS